MDNMNRLLLTLALGAGAAVATKIMNGVQESREQQPCPASVKYGGELRACDKHLKHKGQHHVVLPQAYDPYFRNYYWN
jgi:hypothetical protein